MGIVSLLGAVDSFLNVPRLRVPTKVNNLKDIDAELSRLRAKTGILLRHKQRTLKQMTGMNFHNDSDIEAHLNRTFNKVDEPESDVFEPAEVPYVIKRTKNPFVEPSESLNSENFQVMKNIDFKFKDVGGHDRQVLGRDRQRPD